VLSIPPTSKSWTVDRPIGRLGGAPGRTVVERAHKIFASSRIPAARGFRRRRLNHTRNQRASFHWTVSPHIAHTHIQGVLRVGANRRKTHRSSERAKCRNAQPAHNCTENLCISHTQGSLPMEQSSPTDLFRESRVALPPVPASSPRTPRCVGRPSTAGRCAQRSGPHLTGDQTALSTSSCDRSQPRARHSHARRGLAEGWSARNSNRLAVAGRHSYCHRCQVVDWIRDVNPRAPVDESYFAST